MKRMSPPPRRSSRNRKTNQFFAGDTWVQDEKPMPEYHPSHTSPRPTTPRAKAPAIPRKQKPVLALRQKITRIPVLHHILPATHNAPLTSFSFANRSGNAREIIEITDEEDPVLSMSASVLREKLQCMLCATKMRNRMFVPCGHFVTCAGCADAVTAKGACVCCGSPITSVIHAKFE